MRTRALTWILACCFAVTGCAVDAQPEEEDDLDFSDGGKEDTGRLVEGTPAARAVLRVANEVSLWELEHDANLGINAAKNIVAYRRGLGGPGPRSIPYDEPLDASGNPRPNKRNYMTLAELDARPFVIAVTFSKLNAYASHLGWIEQEELKDAPSQEN
ncbi:MAG: hypothetical protein H0T42_16840 [Deltaproteobacteria bacterium]|nr:hypothetical protein [Deltaproteobacteria bacterium]